MDVAGRLILLALLGGPDFAFGIKFSAESFAEISVLAKEGKFHLESLREKAKVPQFGSCWKDAISDLQIGCKFLSENVQSDLALKFTDCFLQMSGHEPLSCDFPKSACLKKLSDRAFNAYTEFYTHTQSICYFLQSQLWHEETEKTIDKLSTASMQVSQQLEEAEKNQEKLLKQQKESLYLQHDLIDNTKNVVSTLHLSQDKINLILKDFQSSALEQKELLIELFNYLVAFKSWAADELSWFSSTVFFVTAAIMGFLFTSVSRTRGARIFILIIFTFNYLFERFLTSVSMTDTIFINKSTISPNALTSWIWFFRKSCIFFSLIIILYIAFSYCDYNLVNYQLLLEIKNQNLKILNHFALQSNNQNNTTSHILNKRSEIFNSYSETSPKGMYKSPLYSNNKSNLSQDFETSKMSGLDYDLRLKQRFNLYPHDVVDSEENKKSDSVSTTPEKVTLTQEKSGYNLRRNRISKV